MNTTNQVAETIAAQMGGISKLVAMTGAKHFLAGDNSLQFKIGRNANKITAVVITLDADDTYTMTFFRGVKRAGCSVGNVYADSLRRVFESETGMYLSL